MEVIYIIVGSLCTIIGVFVTDYIQYGRQKEKEKREAFARLYTMEDIILINLKKYFDLAAESNHQEKLESHRAHSKAIMGKLENYLNQSYLIELLVQDKSKLKYLKLSKEFIHKFQIWFSDMESHLQLHASQHALKRELEDKVFTLEQKKCISKKTEIYHIHEEINRIKEKITYIEKWDYECKYLSPRMLQEMASNIKKFRELSNLMR